jgi:hypothetical protein
VLSAGGLSVNNQIRLGGALTGSGTITGTQLVSTIATGTAPFTVTSTTVVPNLNVSQLLGQTWANPGAIGGTTPATTVALSGILTSTNTTSATTSLLGAVIIGNGTAATSIGMGAGNIQVGNNLTVTGLIANLGGSLAVGQTATGNGQIYINCAAGQTSNLTFQVAGTSGITFTWEYGLTRFAMRDMVNATEFLQYFPGAIGAANVTFPNTLDASSSTVAANVMSGGLAVAKQLILGGALTINSATMIKTNTTFTNNAGANVGTLNNSPATGNPTKWIPINDNGTIRNIPCW